VLEASLPTLTIGIPPYGCRVVTTLPRCDSPMGVAA
jgi:hypothetical protein